MQIVTKSWVVLILIVLCNCFSVEAQDSKKNSPIEIENIIKARKFRRYLGFELGLNTYWTQPGSFAPSAGQENFKLNYSRSWVFKYNLLEKGWDLVPSKKLRFITGLGIQHNLFRWEEAVAFLPGPLVVAENLEFPQLRVRKNNWRMSTLTLPLLWDWNTAPQSKRNFHLGLGIELGVRTGIRSRLTGELTVEGSDGNVYIDNITRNNFHSRLFQNSLMVRVGYRNLTLFANYGLQPIFLEDKGPSLKVFQLGLRVLSL
jgi:hypothetical protein